MCKLTKIIIIFLLAASCHKGNERMVELQELDNLLEDQAELVLENLRDMDAQELNKQEKAYYYLLLSSAIDKNLIPLSEDSTLKISEKYYKGAKDAYNLARTQYYMAKYSSNQGEKEEAYNQFKKAEANLVPIQEDHPHLSGLIYYQLARIQNTQNNLPEAKFYSRKSLEQFEEARDTFSMVHALKLTGQIYTNEKLYNKAQGHLNEALDLISLYSNQDNKKAREIKAATLNSLSVLHRNMSDLDNALKYSKECINTLAGTDIKVLSEYYYNVLSVFIKLEQTDSIRYYCDQMIAAAKKERRLINLINGYKILAKIEEDQKNYERSCALKDTFNLYKDNYNTKNKSAAFIDLEKKYDLAQKEKQLLSVKNSRLRLFILIIVLVAITSIIGIIFYYKHKKLKTQVEELSETVQHTQWGFAITKELIIENNEAYTELERIFNRFSTESNTEFYKRLRDAFSKQKINYSSKLYSTLTNFDQAFIKKFQEKLPNLTSEDIIMVAMLRHKWNVSDMSAVFHVSVDAARKRKSRLAAKISSQLNRTIVLEEYLKEVEKTL